MDNLKVLYLIKLETALHQDHVIPAEAGIQKVWHVTQSMDFVPMPLLRLLCFALVKVRPTQNQWRVSSRGDQVPETSVVA